MGIKFSIFRKKKNSVEQLENIEAEIKELEVYSADTAQRHRKITRQLLVYSSGFCIVISVLLYFYFPLKMQNKLTLASGLIFFPFLYYATSRLISLYYNRKIRYSQTKLKDLKKEKVRLIDDIMNNETYKVAKDILEKYAPEALPTKYPPPVNKICPNPLINLNRGNLNGNPAVARVPNNLNRLQRSPHQSYSASAPPIQGPQALIFPQCKSYVERVFEYLIGEGPSSKYALICDSCKTHNGMALMEEFEYTAFRCYSCKFFNPARKQRPIAPKLEGEKSDLEEDHIDEESASTSGSDQDAFKIEEITNDNDKTGTDNNIFGNLNPFKSEDNEINENDENSLLLHDDEGNIASSINSDNKLCTSLINESNSCELETENEDHAKGTSSNNEEILSESNLDENSHLLESSQINSVSVTN